MGGVWTIAAVEAEDRSGGSRKGSRRRARWVPRGRGAARKDGLEEGPVNESGEGPKGFTLLDMMPKKVEVSNRYGALVEDEYEEDSQVVGEVGEETVETGVVAGVVEVMVDSGASKSVWPMTLGGVARRKRNVGVRLAAANGSPIKVRGEAALHFRKGREGVQCGFWTLM